MNARPIFFKNQNEFIDFLNNNKNTYGDDIIDRFSQLPQKITNEKGTYQLEIILTPLVRSLFNIGTRYEINYFDDENLYYLFPYINNEDIKVSLDLLEKNLKENDLI